ncbi:hypothetical protein GGQ61_000169 [Phenylobacterium haematophilum]|uniref:DUF4326 domain-containing protein n=1 Tax=Phenylobacterium haematophilum TaxID=98513 RepID=A0A839ZW88_9CAUL|nr:DUF4326 domain-containing protein [Phenylobacterium haematophilum]MBB3889472.1 hypothetical protein [Phenylobacterium haematophilum]
MSRPVRVQLSRQKGWRMPPNTVKVDRTSKWGNSHRIGDDIIVFGGAKAVEVLRNIDAAQAVEAFRTDAARLPPTVWERLRGKNLACWCKIGSPCHADVLLELANAPAQPPGAET